MNEFCPDCGTAFEEPRDLTGFWVRLLRCPDCCSYFLEVGDMRWIFPLQRLELETGLKLCHLPEEAIQAAVPKIQQVDYKTVSIVAFEEAVDAYRAPTKS